MEWSAPYHRPGPAVLPRAEHPFKTASARIDPDGTGWTLHRLRHFRPCITWPASDGTSSSVRQPPPASPPSTTRPPAAHADLHHALHLLSGNSRPVRDPGAACRIRRGAPVQDRLSQGRPERRRVDAAPAAALATGQVPLRPPGQPRVLGQARRGNLRPHHRGTRSRSTSPLPLSTPLTRAVPLSGLSWLSPREAGGEVNVLGHGQLLTPA